MAPRSLPCTCVARARMAANWGADCDVPSALSIVMSGRARFVLPMIPATPFWYDGRS